MIEDVFKEITSAFAVLSMLQARQKALRKDLEFFRESSEEATQEVHESLLFGAYKRLEHEVMFLCVDAYSLHQGISKKRSLYSKVIRQNGKLLSKVDKTPRDRNAYMFLGVIGENGKVDTTSEWEDQLIQGMEKKAYEDRKKTRDDFGISSQKHNEIDEWLDRILDKDIESRLNSYRDEFAHRLDSLEKMMLEIKAVNKPDALEHMLDTVLSALNAYQHALQKILLYTKSLQYQGVGNFEYGSLSRLKLANRYSKYRANES